MNKFYLVFFLLLCFFPSIGKDTTLFKIITSPKPIKEIIKVNGKIIAKRIDGNFEFDGENFTKINLKNSNTNIIFNANKEWAQRVNPNLDFAHVELSNEGIFWVLIKNRFLYGFKISNKIKREFPNHSVRGIYVNGDSLFVSTYQGFYLAANPIFPEILKYSNSNIVLNNGYYYFIGNNERLYKMKTNGDTLVELFAGAFCKICNVSTVSFYKGKLYLGGEKGLGYYNEKGGLQTIQEGVAINSLHVLFGKLWAAADNGIYVLENESLVKISNVQSSTGLFLYDGNIVSTSYRGLWIFDVDNNRTTNILEGTRYEKIETDAFYADDYGNYWISTISGFLKYNVRSKNISVFLEGTEFNRRAYFFKGDTVLFGSNTEGLISFDIKDLIAEDGQYESTAENYSFLYMIIFLLTVSLMILLYFRTKQAVPDLPPVSLPDKSPVEGNYWVNLAQFIRENVDNVTVEEIRSHSGLTKHSFYSKFFQQFGKNPKEFLMEIKQMKLEEKQKK